MHGVFRRGGGRGGAGDVGGDGVLVGRLSGFRMASFGAFRRLVTDRQVSHQRRDVVGFGDGFDGQFGQESGCGREMVGAGSGK